MSNTRDEQRCAFEAHLLTCTTCRIDVTLGTVDPALCGTAARLLLSYVRHGVSYAAAAQRAATATPAAARRAGTTAEALRQLVDAQVVTP